jgi:hypothetical protein
VLQLIGTGGRGAGEILSEARALYLDGHYRAAAEEANSAADELSSAEEIGLLRVALGAALGAALLMAARTVIRRRGLGPIE